MITLTVFTRAGAPVGFEVRGHEESRVCSFVSGIVDFVGKGVTQNIPDISTADVQNDPHARGDAISVRVVLTDADASRPIPQALLETLRSQAPVMAAQGLIAFAERDIG